MAPARKTNAELIEDNRRLRAQVAQLEDRLDHLAEHGAAAKALQQSEALHRDVMAVVSDVVLIADDAGRLTYVSPNAQLIFGHSPDEIIRQGRIHSLLSSDLFDPDVLEQRGDVIAAETLRIARIVAVADEAMPISVVAKQPLPARAEPQVSFAILQRRVDPEVRHGFAAGIDE